MPIYVVADAYYACGKIADGLIKKGDHLVSRVKFNAVAFEECTQPDTRKRGRPKKYGAKVLLKSLLNDKDSMQVSASIVYGETQEHCATGRETSCGVHPGVWYALWRSVTPREAVAC